jgi:CHAD domain-containing protein
MIEREVKLAAPPGFRLLDLGAVADDLVVVTAPDRRFTSIYWDTDDLRLIRWGCTLRFRLGEGWTVKLPERTGGGRVMSRAEHVFQGPQNQPPADAVDLVRAYVRSATLARVARLRTVRRVVSLRTVDGTPLAEVDDDDVTILDGSRVASRFREIEAEIPESTPRDLLDAVVDHLMAAGAHTADPTPKLVRALGAPALAPPDVDVATLPDDARAGDVVRRAIAASVQRLLRHDPGVRIGEDPEAVHQARVATRRLRSDLRTFAPLLDPQWSRALRDELKWLADELGTVRDGDVLLMRLRDSVAQVRDVDRAPLDGVLGELEADLARERARLLEGMRTARYLTLLDDLVAAAADPVLVADASRRAADVLPRLVSRPWSRLVREHAAMDSPPTDDQLHQLRIRAKRVRYAAEAVAPVVGRPATALATAAAGLQTVLGDFHDAIVAADWLRRHTGRSPARAFAVGVLYAMELHRADEQRRAWPKAWKALSRKRLHAWM